MQDHHSATLVKIKQHPSDAVLSQVRPYLVNTTAYGAAYRHTHRPAKLDGLDVLADSLAVLAGREAFQPFPNRLSAGLSPVKYGPDAFTLQVSLGSFFALGLLADVCHNLLYHIRYTSVSFFARAAAQALNSNGQSVTGLTWTSSNPQVISLSTDDPPILTALSAGRATIAVGNSSADVTVYSGSSLPLGTTIWSNPGD